MTEQQTKPISWTGAPDTTKAFQSWPGATPVATPVESSTPHRRRRWLAAVAGLVVLVLFLIPFLVFAAVYKQSRSNEARPADAIVVLGAAQFNGVPSQVFQARLDTALSLYQQGYADTIVVTGGRLLGDQYTEAEAGKNYLVEHGVPADAILMENISHNTAQSFDGVRRILSPRGAETLLLVSDGFHLYRSKMLAENAGFAAYGVAAEDSPIRPGSGTELRYMIRETFGVLAWKLHLAR